MTELSGALGLWWEAGGSVAAASDRYDVGVAQRVVESLLEVSLERAYRDRASADS